MTASSDEHGPGPSAVREGLSATGGLCLAGRQLFIPFFTLPSNSFPEYWPHFQLIAQVGSSQGQVGSDQIVSN